MVRPLTNIDWKKADELMIAGCNGVQIAGYFGIHPDTFYRHVEKEKGVGFTAYLQEKQSKGEALLVAHQYAKALGLTNNGDNTLLVWLGKTRLKQKEHTDEVIAKEVESKFDALMIQMKENQARNIDENNNSTEIKS